MITAVESGILIQINKAAKSNDGIFEDVVAHQWSGILWDHWFSDLV